MCHGEQIGTTCSVSGPSRNATVDQIKDPPKPPRGRPGCRQASDAASPLSLSLSKPALLCQRTINPKSQATRRDDTPTPRGARPGWEIQSACRAPRADDVRTAAAPRGPRPRPGRTSRSAAAPRHLVSLRSLRSTASRDRWVDRRGRAEQAAGGRNGRGGAPAQAQARHNRAEQRLRRKTTAPSRARAQKRATNRSRSSGRGRADHRPRARGRAGPRGNYPRCRSS